MNGITVNNSSSNTIQNCNISYCSSNGVLGFNTSGLYGALTINNSTFSNNTGRGLGLSSARADLNYVTMLNNGFQGIYALNSTCYLTYSRIEANSYTGMLFSGAYGQAVLGSKDYGAGHNTVYNNNASHSSYTHEISLTSGATALVGFYDYEVTYWGYNNIYRGPNAIDGQKLISNGSGQTVMAHVTYWGSPSGPTASDFDGAVDYSFYLSGPARPNVLPPKGGHTVNSMTQGSLGGTNMSALDSLRLIRLVGRLSTSMLRNPDSAQVALHLLSTLVGPGGVLPENLVGGWDLFLRRTASSTTSQTVRDLCAALRVHSCMRRGQYDVVIGLADAFLSQNPSDQLWMLCQTEKFSALLSKGEIPRARALFQSMITRARRIDPNAVAMLDEILQVAALSPNPQRNGSLGKDGNPQTQNAKPQTYALEQNYPNPFNPTTTIRFAIPQSEHVTLKVYDLLGREVATLVNEVRNAGSYSETFPASGGFDASKLASGVYIYTLKAGSFIASKKFVLLK